MVLKKEKISKIECIKAEDDIISGCMETKEIMIIYCMEEDEVIINTNLTSFLIEVSLFKAKEDNFMKNIDR